MACASARWCPIPISPTTRWSSSRYPMLPAPSWRAPRSSCATWHRPAATCCSERAAPISMTRPRPATSASPAAAAPPSTASTVVTPSSVPARPASPMHPSDMCVVLAALDAKVHVMGPVGRARDRVCRLPPAARRYARTSIPTSKPDEIITAVELPAKGFASNYSYLKIRDRLSYAFALVSDRRRAGAGRRHDQGGAPRRSAASRTSPGAIRRPKRRCAGGRPTSRPLRRARTLCCATPRAMPTTPSRSSWRGAASFAR